MFKKTVLVGILLVTLLVLSGCGAYDPNCTESSGQRCYGKMVVQKAKADGTCEAGQMNIGGNCLAVGDAARCSQLDAGSAESVVKLKWGSVNVNGINVCYPTCSTDADCGLNSVCRTGSGGASNLKTCVPYCYPVNNNADCLPGLTTCQYIDTKYGYLCMPASSITVCVPKTSYEVCQYTVIQCGVKIKSDGCGGQVKCDASSIPTGFCTAGQICTIDNTCVDALSKVLPVDYPQYKQDLLATVVVTLKKDSCTPETVNLDCAEGYSCVNGECQVPGLKVQKLAALIQAIKAWFAAQ